MLHSSVQKQPFCRFYITRHGETVWNTRKVMQGHKDSPLTDNGMQQAKEIAKKLRHINFSNVFSSDLQRAVRTAEIIVADRNLEVRTNQLLRESYFGMFEGKELAFFLNTLKKSIEHRETLSSDERMKYKVHPQVESEEEISTRMMTFLKDVAPRHEGENVLVVSHSAVMRATLIKIGFATHESLPQGVIKNAGCVVIETDGSEFTVTETLGIEIGA